MDQQRRNLMKGMLTGGTLLAFGAPSLATAMLAAPFPGKTRSVALLLGNTSLDDSFARGASRACSVYMADRGGTGEVAESGPVETGPPGFRAVKLEDALLFEVENVSRLLSLSHDIRWIALMDDASAAVFTEMVRNAGAPLLLRGSHVASAQHSTAVASGVPVLRHLWTSASPAYSAGEILACQLVRHHRSFSIVENLLGEPPSEADMAITCSYSAPGFQSYRLAGSQERHLYCSGMSRSEGCGLLGWDEAGRWIPLPDSGKHEAFYRTSRDWQPADWGESLGFAITAVALGMEQKQVLAASRGFVHRGYGKRANHGSRAGQGEQGRADGRMFAEERLASFIIDV